MNANEKEAYVWERWVEVQVNTGYEGDFFVVNLADSYAFNTWQAAYDFTLQREKEIAEVEEEIEFQQHIVNFMTGAKGYLAFCRTLTRLQAIRAELGKGMKG